MGGIDRKETNAKVIESFYEEDSYHSILVSKSNPLVDALILEPLAEKMKSPIVMISDTVSDYQEYILNQKSTNFVYQIADDLNKDAFNRVIELLK